MTMEKRRPSDLPRGEDLSKKDRKQLFQTTTNYGIGKTAEIKATEHFDAESRRKKRGLAGLLASCETAEALKIAEVYTPKKLFEILDFRPTELSHDEILATRRFTKTAEGNFEFLPKPEKKSEPKPEPTEK